MIQMNETVKSILDRRSTRGFESEPLSDEIISVLEQCALASPTAMNMQSWHFSFVTDRDKISAVEKRVVELIHKSGDEAFISRMKERNNSVFYNAPLVIFISSDANSKWSAVDAGIAVENLALAAHSLSLGSVIIGMCASAFDGEEGELLGKELAFPETHKFQIALAVGKPTVSKDAHPTGENKISRV
ncbi:MAG: nitroreductase family protein [Ruminococcaceae bacterium]|nr:nitroreductase family protein [Oscillospiraceae bacterium]